MKVFKNQTKQTAKDLGYLANWTFASNKDISPNYRDIMNVRNSNGDIVSVEVTEYDEKSKTARISIMSLQEYNKWSDENI